MASIKDKNGQQCASNRNNNDNPTKSKKSNRKHKSKSLIVPSILDSVDGDDDEKNGSRSAGCDSSTFDFRHRFSFCSFRRGRSLSKTRLNDSTSTTPEPGENGPILIVDHVKDGDTNDTTKTTKTTTTTNQQPSIRKSRSVVDFRSICSKLHRHLTIGTDTIKSLTV